MEKRDSIGFTEAEYIEKFREKDYPRPSLTADILIFADGRTKLLLIKRKGHPYIGQWAFPGGFAESTETIECTAARELEEETGIKGLDLKMIKLFSRPGRDPRGWTVSMAYSADVELKNCRAVAGDDAAEAEWFTLKKQAAASHFPAAMCILRMTMRSTERMYPYGSVQKINWHSIMRRSWHTAWKEAEEQAVRPAQIKKSLRD